MPIINPIFKCGIGYTFHIPPSYSFASFQAASLLKIGVKLVKFSLWLNTEHPKCGLQNVSQKSVSNTSPLLTVTVEVMINHYELQLHFSELFILTMQAGYCIA